MGFGIKPRTEQAAVARLPRGDILSERRKHRVRGTQTTDGSGLVARPDSYIGQNFSQNDKAIIVVTP